MPGAGYFLIGYTEQIVEQTAELPVIWVAMTFTWDEPKRRQTHTPSEVMGKWWYLAVQWNLSVTTTSIIKFITCDLFSNVF